MQPNRRHKGRRVLAIVCTTGHLVMRSDLCRLRFELTELWEDILHGAISDVLRAFRAFQLPARVSRFLAGISHDRFLRSGARTRACRVETRLDTCWIYHSLRDHASARASAVPSGTSLAPESARGGLRGRRRLRACPTMESIACAMLLESPCRPRWHSASLINRLLKKALAWQTECLPHPRGSYTNLLRHRPGRRRRPPSSPAPTGGIKVVFGFVGKISGARAG